MKLAAKLLLLAALAPLPAAADVVILADGQRIEGVVAEEGDQVVVQLGFGSVSFPRSEVVDVRRESTPLHELEQRRARLDPNDAAGRLALARWAEQNGLADAARDLYREVLSLRPEDPTAHERLGHRKHEGRWMTDEEYLAATGHVLYGGRWISRAEAEQLEREARERRDRQEEQERIEKLEARVASQQEKIEELESRPEPEGAPGLLWGNAGYYGWGWGAWWLPHQPAFGHRHVHPAPHPHHRHRHLPRKVRPIHRQPSVRLAH